MQSMEASKAQSGAAPRPLRGCSLVVDCGFSFTHVVPMWEDSIVLPGVRWGTTSHSMALQSTTGQGILLLCSLLQWHPSPLLPPAMASFSSHHRAGHRSVGHHMEHHDAAHSFSCKGIAVQGIPGGTILQRIQRSWEKHHSTAHLFFGGAPHYKASCS